MDRPSARRIAGETLALLLCACAIACTGSISSRGSASRGGVGNQAGAGAFSPGAGAAANGSAGASGGGAGANAGASGGAGNTAGTLPNGNPLECVTEAVGPSPMRRLTHAEYDNSVRDLLGDTTKPARSFAPDTQVGLFDNTVAAQTVPVLLADQYLGTAVSLAEDIADIPALVGCDPAGADGANCVRGFIERFGRRAYRRPLTADETTDLVALHDSTRSAADEDTAVRSIVAAVLASPNFLFRPEAGAADSALPDAKQLTQFEIAGRLAALLWASVPDEPLLDLAASGQLGTPEQVEAEARRMLDDDKAGPAMNAFYEQWLGLPLLDSATKEAAAYPQWSEELRSAMQEETERFISHVLWEDDARLETLFTAPYSFVNASLAELYGVAGPADDATFVQTTLDPSERSGVLTHASMMAAYASPTSSSPIKRGKWVRVRLLCQDLPDPPANIPPPPAPAAGVSTRERFAMHTDSDACRGCHTLIDGLGFGLEHYDGIGKYRDTDQGVDVNASGEVNSTTDINGPYSGGPELASLLASSEQARDCVPTQWLRYALGRREDDDDTCSLVAVRQAFAASDGDLRELMVALTQTNAFLTYRQPE